MASRRIEAEILAAESSGSFGRFQVAYTARIYGLGSSPLEVGDLRLHDNDEVPLPLEGSHKLGHILDRLFPPSSAEAVQDLAFFTPRRQLGIGHYLLSQLFGDHHLRLRELASSHGVELRIVSNREEIVRLPWTLVAHEGLHLVTARSWSVSLASTRDPAAILPVSMPALPRVLIVLPELGEEDRIQSRLHRDELESLFEAEAAVPYRWSGYVRTVSGWEEFQEAAAEQPPHIVYFYGHGSGNRDDSALQFRGERNPVSMQQLASCLSQSVKVLFLNCCLGDAGGFLGVGMQLRGRVPAIFCNRTYAWSRAARLAGRIFFESMLLDGAAPDIAFTRLCSFNPAEPGSTANRPESWMTPCLHASYGSWKSSGLRKAATLPEKAYSFETFDRTEQIGQVTNLLHRLTEKKGRRYYALLWHGTHDDGVAACHDNLRRAFQRDGNIIFKPARHLDWPEDLLAGHFDLAARNSLAAKLCEVFDILAPAQILQQIESELTSRPRGGRVICYIPVTSGEPAEWSLACLRTLLAVWDAKFAEYFEPDYVPIFGFGLETAAQAETFSKAVETWEVELDQLNLRWIHLERLEPLGPVRDKDIDLFLREDISIRDHQRRKKLVEAILAASNGGRFELVLKILKDTRRLDELGAGF